MTMDVDLGPSADRLVLLVDPGWQPSQLDDATEPEGPPAEALIGAWYFSSDGAPGEFVANPEYWPAGPQSPTDAVDATVRLVASGALDVDHLIIVVRDAMFGVALDGAGQPMVVPAQDDARVLLATSAEPHRGLVPAASWRLMPAPALFDLARAEQADVLVNSQTPHAIRLAATSVHEPAEE